MKTILASKLKVAWLRQFVYPSKHPTCLPQGINNIFSHLRYLVEHGEVCLEVEVLCLDHPLLLLVERAAAAARQPEELAVLPVQLVPPVPAVPGGRALATIICLFYNTKASAVDKEALYNRRRQTVAQVPLLERGNQKRPSRLLLPDHL